jgi:hypothetical protein
MMEFVSWDDENPIYGKIKNVPNHQAVMDYDGVPWIIMDST